jgi:hypothetical protein
MLLFAITNAVSELPVVLIVIPAPRSLPNGAPRSPVSVLLENVTLLVPELVAFVENWK